VNSEQRSHRRGFAQHQQQQSRQACQKQQRQERDVHAVLLQVHNSRVAAQLERVESERADQQADAAESSQHNRNAEVPIRRLPPKYRVVNGGDGRRGQAQQESIESEMMKTPPGL